MKPLFAEFLENAAVTAVVIAIRSNLKRGLWKEYEW